MPVEILIVICLISAAALFGALVLLTSYICFRMAFYASGMNPGMTVAAAEGEEVFDLPPDDIYVPFHEKMKDWAREVRSLPCEEFCVKSFDGLNLYGKYYECEPGATIELMMHGYRGSAERDLCGGVQRCFALGRNVLIIDQRACGKSEGNVISFGINESRDCLAWVDFIVEHFGKDVKIILTGISMGASTVIMAAARGIPSNVKGILADCGYSSQEKIIKKVIKDMKLPANVLYPFVKIGSKLYGKFNIDEISPLEATKKINVPIIFFHGENDAYVPCEMSRENYESCTGPKRLVTVPDAGHGLAYPVMKGTYLDEVASFFTENGVPTRVRKEY
jgi:pimeloyl-ACP methyl ester carboxylesterase